MLLGTMLIVRKVQKLTLTIDVTFHIHCMLESLSRVVYNICIHIAACFGTTTIFRHAA